MVLIGPATDWIAEEANLAASICSNVELAISELKRVLMPGSVVLIKGSRALAMERIVEDLMCCVHNQA